MVGTSSVDLLVDPGLVTPHMVRLVKEGKVIDRNPSVEDTEEVANNPFIVETLP